MLEDQGCLTEEQANTLSNFRASACALRDIVEKAREAATTMGIPINDIILSDACDDALAGMQGWS